MLGKNIYTETAKNCVLRMWAEEGRDNKGLEQTA
jgi:hypothetical protein